MRVVIGPTVPSATLVTAPTARRRCHGVSAPASARPLVLVLSLIFAALAATSSALACVVGTGTSASCTETGLNGLDACLPGGASFDGTVTFACGGAATITVTSPKAIRTDTTIDGGSVITISGGNTVGVFSVTSGITFTVENLTIVNGAGSSSGSTGGAISNNGGTLKVTNSTFSSNNASDNGRGGAIFNGVGGTLTVNNSTFSTNLTGEGGAIYNAGGTTVTNSTFSSNNATFFGGAIFGAIPTREKPQLFGLRFGFKSLLALF